MFEPPGVDRVLVGRKRVTPGSSRGRSGWGERHVTSHHGWGRLLAHRDQGCRFPGCHYRLWVHAHHIIHWSQGGSTKLDNLITLCGYHHRLVHEAGWKLSGDPNGEVTWIKPDGTPDQPTRVEHDLANLARSMRGTATIDTS